MQIRPVAFCASACVVDIIWFEGCVVDIIWLTGASACTGAIACVVDIICCERARARVPLVRLRSQ